MDDLEEYIMGISMLGDNRWETPLLNYVTLLHKEHENIYRIIRRATNTYMLDA